MSHENKSMRLTGDLYAFRITSGVEASGLGPLNADVLGFQSNVETIDVPDKRRARRGQLMASYTDASPATGKLTLYSVPAKVLAMLMLGTIVARNDAGGTRTATAATVPADYWTPLAHRHVSAVVVTSDPAGTTYEINKDYELDDKLGLIRAISGSAMASDPTVLIAYTYKAVTGDRIQVGTDLTTRARLLLRGVNDADDSAVEWEAYQAILTPAGEIDLLSSEPLKAEFNLKFETPSGYTHPIRLDYPVYAA